MLSAMKPSSIPYFVFSQNSFAHKGWHSSLFTFYFRICSFRSNSVAPTLPGRVLCPYRNWGVLDDSDNSDPEKIAPNNNNSVELFQHFSGISDENASGRNNILIEMQKSKMQM